MSELEQQNIGFTNRVLQWLSIAVRGGAIFGMVILSAMVLLTTVNVASRYVFSAPIYGTTELTGLLLVCLTAAGLSYCQLEKGHIRVSIVVSRLSKKSQAILDSLAYLIGFASIALVCWYSFVRARKYLFLTRGEVTELLGIHFFPFMFIFFLGFALFALLLLVHLIQSTKGIFKNE